MPNLVATRRIVLNANDARITLNEIFAGNQINTARWTVTDSESKLSVSGGNLVCAGGLATPAWNDPRIYRTSSVLPLAGLTVEFEINISTLQELMLGLDSANPPVVDHDVGFYITGANGAVSVDDNGAVKTLPLTLLADTSYRVRIVCANPGWRLYYSADGGITYSLLWQKATGLTAAQFVVLTSKAAAFTVSYIRIYRGSVKPAVYSATPAAPVPVLGDELLTDGGMENWASATNLTSWTEYIAGTSTINREDSVVDSGTYAARLDIDGSGSNAELEQALAAFGTGNWCQLTARLRASASGKLIRLDFSAGSEALNACNPGTTWTTYTITGRATSASPTADVRRSAGGAASSSLYVDNVSAKKLTLSSCLTLVCDAGTKNGIVDSAPTVATATQCGHAFCLDDEANPLYFLLAYHNGTNAVLLKCENGTYTSLISAAATYSAGAQLRTVKVGNSVGLYYNGTKIGSTATVDTSSNYGTKVAAFSTLSTNSPGAVAVETGVGV